MRPESIPDFSQRRMDRVSWGQEVERTPIVRTSHLVRCVRKISQAFSASAIVLNGEPPNLIAGLFK